MGNTVTTFAGDHEPAGFGFADGTGTAAHFAKPYDVKIKDGNYIIADSENHRIRMVTPAGVVTTIAGSGNGYADGPVAAAKFSRPRGLAVAANGDIYVSEVTGRIRLISNGVVSTIAGNGTTGFANGVGTEAIFHFPYGIVVNNEGVIYVADSNNHMIRQID